MAKGKRNESGSPSRVTRAGAALVISDRLTYLAETLTEASKEEPLPPADNPVAGPPSVEAQSAPTQERGPPANFAGFDATNFVSVSILADFKDDLLSAFRRSGLAKSEFLKIARDLVKDAEESPVTIDEVALPEHAPELFRDRRAGEDAVAFYSRVWLEPFGSAATREVVGKLDPDLVLGVRNRCFYLATKRPELVSELAVGRAFVGEDARTKGVPLEETIPGTPEHDLALLRKGSRERAARHWQRKQGREPL